MEIRLAAALNADCAAVINLSSFQQAKVEKAAVKHRNFSKVVTYGHEHLWQVSFKKDTSAKYSVPINSNWAMNEFLSS